MAPVPLEYESVDGLSTIYGCLAVGDYVATPFFHGIVNEIARPCAANGMDPEEREDLTIVKVAADSHHSKATNV